MSSWLTFLPPQQVTSSRLVPLPKCTGEGASESRPWLLQCGVGRGGPVLQPVPWSSLATGVERASSSPAVLSQQGGVSFCPSRGWGCRTGCCSKVCSTICRTLSSEDNQCHFSPVAEMLPCKNQEKYGTEAFQQGLATSVK